MSKCLNCLVFSNGVCSASKMTQVTYKSFFQIVIRILLLNYPQPAIITDFERSLMNATKGEL